MILSLIFILLIFGILAISFIQKNNLFFLRSFALTLSGIVLFLSILLFVLYDETTLQYQLYADFTYFNLEFLQINFLFGLDGISLIFFLLTSYLVFLCVLFIWNEEGLKKYLILLFILELFLLLTFSVLDVLLFYICFETILIPMYLMMGIWGSREKKIRAAYLLFFFTLIGSILFFVGLWVIKVTIGTFNIEYITSFQEKFSYKEQLFLWIVFFVAFASKMPLFPFHIWLPEAHVEAPTIGSVLLAGVLLKLGVYGFLRYSLVITPLGSQYFSPIVYTLSIAGVIYASLSAIKQTDLKKIIAYSSVAHMNLVMLGLFSGNISGVKGALFQSLSHGLVASALFFLIGMLYNRYHSRLLSYYSGLVQIMPLYAFFFLFFTMSNIGLPGTSSFIGEFVILKGVFEANYFSGLMGGMSVVLSGAYSLWLYNRVCFGNLKTPFLEVHSDLSFREIYILSSLFFFSFYLGLFPTYVFEMLDASSIRIDLLKAHTFLVEPASSSVIS